MSRWADAYHASVRPRDTVDSVDSAHSFTQSQPSTSPPQEGSVSSVRRVTADNSIDEAGGCKVSAVSAVSCPTIAICNLDARNYLPAAPRCPPAWPEQSARPRSGYFCGCCGSRHWWSDTKGWRCWTCHPCSHLSPDAVIELRT